MSMTGLLMGYMVLHSCKDRKLLLVVAAEQKYCFSKHDSRSVSKCVSRVCSNS